MLIHLIFISAFSANSQEQNILFSLLENPPELDSSATNIVAKIEANTMVENYFFVSINPIDSIVAGQYIPINFPVPNDTTLNFYTKQVKYIADSNYVWHGFLIEEDSSYIHSGHCTIISSKGKKFGSFRVDSIYFDLVDLGANNNVLVQYKHNETLTSCGVGKIDSIFAPPEPPDSNLVAELRGTGPCPIKVLILYTEEAEKMVAGDIEQTAKISFEQTVNALYNSDIKVTDFNLDLVGIEFLPNFFELIAIGSVWNDHTGEWEPPVSQLTRLTNYQQFVIDEIQNSSSNMFNLRKDYEADLVILLGQVSGWISDVNGFSNLGPDKNKPIAVIDAAKSTKNYLFAHELGHLFGCHHEECSAPWSTGNCFDGHIQARHPHRWQNSRWLGFSKVDRFSIMYAEDSKKTRAYFSNPDVKTHSGKKTGTQWRNNVSWLKDMGCIISNWNENEAQPLFSYITGPNKDCPCANITLSAQIQGGGSGPYTYNWSYSYNGFSYTDYPFNSSNAFLEMPCPYSLPPQEGDGIYVRLEVIDSELNSHITWHFVEVISNDTQGSPCLIPEQRISNPSQDKIEIGIFPIPTSNFVEIHIRNLPEDGQKWDLNLLNINGQKIRTQRWNLEHGDNQFKIDLSSYPAGLYLLQFVNSNTQELIEVKKLVKQ